MAIVLPLKRSFCPTFSRQSSRSSRRSTTPGTSFRAPQATATYKYPVNSPERGLEKKTESKAPPLLELLL